MRKKTRVSVVVGILVLMTATIPLTIAQPVSDEEIEEAISLGVAWLASQQNLDGSWGPSSYRVVYTGFVLIKLQDRAYELEYESPFDPGYEYSDEIIEGWNFIFSTDGGGNPLYAKTQTLTVQDHTAGVTGTLDDPDVDGDGIGIYFVDYWYPVYTTGVMLMALEASGTPGRNDGTIDFDGDSEYDTFLEIAQDAADWLAWAQGDLGWAEGGWSYEPRDNADGSTDNSNGGYAVLGLAAAEGFGCSVPDWVKTELDVWITVLQDPVDGDPWGNDGGSSYTPYGSWENELKTGNLIFEMTFCGDDPDTQRFIDAMDYIERHWKDYNQDPGWRGNKGIDNDGDGLIDEDPVDGIDNDGDSLIDEDPPDGNIVASYQAMYCLMKGFEYSGIELIDLDSDDTPEHDWYQEFAQVLLYQQKADGSWPITMWDWTSPYILSTVWALLTLERVAPPPPVIPVFVDIKPGSWPNPINLKSKGVISVAICGLEDFDVSMIDPASVEIVLTEDAEPGTGVSPLRWSYEDVATPYEPEEPDEIGGHELGADGYTDLVLKFDTQELVITLSLADFAGETIPLIIKGFLKEEYDGTAIQGQDFVWILNPKGKE